jgi:xanthine/CO dehydrogenase XdhC/CoxF family maturation factor
MFFCKSPVDHLERGIVARIVQIAREASMKHWQETSRIMQLLLDLAEQGRTAALATVIHIEGSAYRRPGAKMLILDDGEMFGSISGGCLEADVREVGLSVMRGGEARLLHYDTGTDYQLPFGLGLGCNGSVDIFVQRAVPDLLEIAGPVTRLLQGDDPFAVCTVIRGSRAIARSVVVTSRGKRLGSTRDVNLDHRIATNANGLLELGLSQRQDFAGDEVFVELQVPPPSLIIFGAGEDTRPLARCAAEVGFRVAVVDHRPAYLSPDNYPAEVRLVEARAEAETSDVKLGALTYAVVKTHSVEHDRKWVARLLASDVPYIGVLGPRARTEEILRELRSENDERIFGPIGIDLGADGPEQIAVSIVAELLARVSGREPMHLRQRESAIHVG